MSNEVGKATNQEIDPADIPPLGPDDILIGINREEMGILLRHWHTEVLETEHSAICTVESMWRELRHANSRASRMEAVLGEDETNSIIEEVERAMRAKCGSARWRVLRHGTVEEKNHLCDEAEQEHYRCSSKLEEPHLALSFLRSHPTRAFIDGDGDLWCWLVDPRLGITSDRPDLALTILSPVGGRAYSRSSRMPMPDGWFPPYGL
jgi:hypothetical protein